MNNNFDNFLLIFDGGDKTWLSIRSIQWHKHNMETWHHTLRSFLKHTATKKIYTPWRQLITSKMMVLEKVINVMYTHLLTSLHDKSLKFLIPSHIPLTILKHHPNSPSAYLSFHPSILLLCTVLNLWQHPHMQNTLLKILTQHYIYPTATPPPQTPTEVPWWCTS